MGVPTPSQLPTGHRASVGVPTVKLSANQYQGGDIQRYKNKDAGMTIKLREMVNRESAYPQITPKLIHL